MLFKNLKNKTLVSVCVIAVILLFFPHSISKGCGPFEYGFQGYSFINLKTIVNDEGVLPYFISFERVYERHFKRQEALRQLDNLNEWRERFCDLVELEDLQYIIYQASADEIQRLNTAVKSPNIPLSYRVRSNSFAQHLKANQCIEVANYLLYAKNCEPHVVRRSGWSIPPRKTDDMIEMAQDGIKLFRRTKSHYVKLRLAYQIIRLAHYAGAHEWVVELYDFLLPKIDRQKPSIIYYWLLSHKAGALKKLGKNVEASYLFTKIFLKCSSMREAAFQSFYLRSDEEWHRCFVLCENDDERATLYAIRASASHSNAVEEMEKIYELDSDNEHLEPLLVREMLRLEKDLLGLEFNDKRAYNLKYHQVPREAAGKYVIALQGFVRQCALEGKVEKPELWKIAEGYLEFLAGDYYAAATTFNQVRENISEPVLKDQLGAFELALYVAAQDEIDEEMEEDMYDIIKNDPFYKKFDDFPDFLNDKLASLYQKYDQKGKAFLSRHTLRELSFNPDLTILDQLLVIAQKINPNKLEENKFIGLDQKKFEYDLLDLKGTYLLSQFQLEAAYETFKKIPRTDRDIYGQFNPFRERLRECVHCPISRIDTVSLNKVELVQTILQYEYDGRAQRENGGSYFYLLGVAFYNMSYYGYAWNILDQYRSGASWRYLNEENVYPLWEAPGGNIEHKDCSKALQYFETARLIADGQDPELAAKATFMAARCRQKMYYSSKEFRRPPNNQIPVLPPEYSHYFDVLIEKYSDTEFFQDAIQECKYFEAYVKK